ncbi:alpha/beta hydrolase [Insolitispirillum peregrinum]|uniref:alpha/beta hydrolase n=1 Tax=Insolitispirillum peregrinum TaxID=80876 RepID=UPI003606E588
MSAPLILTLHGVGSNGADMAPVGEALASVVPGSRTASPDAPDSFGGPSFGGAGRWQWFSIDGVTTSNRPQRVMAARAAFDAVVGQIIAAHGLEQALDRVVFAGFSQGAIMALDAVASGRWAVGAVLAFSGRLASPLPLTPASGTPVLLLHGEADPVMPTRESLLACDALTLQGMRAEVQTFPGLGHGISPATIAAGQRFLSGIYL